MTDLPDGWVETALDEIAATSLGKMLDARQRTGLHQTPYLRNVNVRWGAFDLSDVATMDIEPRELDRVLAQPGDLVACEGGEPGRSAVWRGREAVALQKALHKIRPAAGVLPDYLALLLREQSSTGELDKLFTGTTIKHLPQEKLRLVRVPLAPTAEQERIVAAIEEAFSKLDAGEAGLRTVRQLLKRMRGAILAAAVTGRLVPQDPTDTPAPKLLADLGIEPLEREDLPDLPDSWVHARLDALAGVHDCEHRTPKFSASGIPAFRPRDVVGGTLDLMGAAKVAEGEYLRQSRRHALRPGDIVYSRELSLGWAAVLRSEPACLSQGMVAISPLSIAAEYLVLYLNGPGRQVAVASQAGSAHPHLNLRDIRALRVPLPPREEQDRIVAEVERQMSFLDACERAVDAGLERSAALRRSVLKAAFEGRLVPQDLTDEPASVLLERIRAERVAAPKAKTRRAKAKS